MRPFLAPGRGIRLAALSAALGAVLGAAPALAQSLPDAMVTAYLDSPELAAARADVNVLSERAVQARAGGRVRVEGELSLFAQTQTNSGPGVSFPNYPASVSLSVVQPLYTGGQVENATEAAEIRISKQDALLIATEQEILLDTVTAFVDVRRDLELVSIARNNVRVLTEQLLAARERFEVGEVTRTDVEQARARLAAARSRLAATKGALANSREAYRRVVGDYPDQLQPPPPLPDLPSSKDQAVAMALRDDPGVIAARLERKAVGSDVRAAIGALLPQVSLQGRISSQETFSDGLAGPEKASIGIVMTVPLYTGGFNYSTVREAQAAAEGALATIDNTMRIAARNVGISWANLDVARASIRAGRLEVSAARLAFEGVREEAMVGARTTLDVLDAEQEVLNARSNLTVAQHDEYVAAYSLLASIGKLTVGHLGLDVGLAAGTEPSYYAGVRNRNFGYDASDDTVWRLDWRP
ncbi:MAG: TolC family outer membrane protein [Proteobacteria bacterium]|nr:TolC family outer membrane protein [Pseudomonadota bacterium]